MASKDDMWAITIVALIIAVMIGGALFTSPNWRERPWTLVTRDVVEFGVGGDGGSRRGTDGSRTGTLRRWTTAP